MTIGSVITGVGKIVGKNILKSAFPGLYSLHQEYKSNNKKKEDEMAEPKTELGKEVKQLDDDVKESNILLSSQNQIIAGQSVILEQILQSINSFRLEIAFGKKTIPNLNLSEIEEDPRKNFEKLDKNKKVSSSVEEAQKKGGGKYIDKNGKLQEISKNEKGKWQNKFAKGEGAATKRAEIELAKKTEQKVSKSVLSRFIRFLEKKGATVLAKKLAAKLVALGAGALVPGIGWIADVLLVAGSIYDVYDAYQYWKEFAAQDKEEGVSTSIPDASGGNEQQKYNNVTYSSKNMLFQSKEMNIIAKEIVLSDDLINLLKGIKPKNILASVLPAPAAEDASDREKALTGPGGVGDKLKGRTGSGDVQGLQPSFSEPLNKMIAAAKEAGYGIRVNSGFRTEERQAELFKAAVQKYGSEDAARKWVAPPGKSMHNKGLAADLGFSGAAASQWAHDNASKFGLNFRMGYEPWHIENIRAYAEGTNYVPKTGPAIVGEKGHELVIGKDGVKVTPNEATVVNLNQGDKVIPSGTVRPLMGSGESTPMAPIGRIDSPAELKMKKYLEGVPNDPVLQAGLKKIGGAQNINMKQDLLTTSNVYGVYIPPDVNVKNAAANKTLDAYRNKIFLAPERAGFKVGDETIDAIGPEQVKTTLQHELTHAATQNYWEKNLISPEMTSEIKGFTGKSPKDAGLYGSGLGEEARQRIRDLETRGEYMDYTELSGISEFVSKYKPYDEKNLSPDQRDEYEASRDRMLSHLSRDVERAYSSTDMLNQLGNYK